MTTITDIKLVQASADYESAPDNGGSENQWFSLKAEDVEVSVGNNMIARAILSSVGEMVGADPILNTEKYKVMGVKLYDVEESDYPSSLVPDTVPDDATKEKEMESALRLATKSWGPAPDTAGDTFDKLIWHGEPINIVITDYSARESAEEPKPDNYTVDFELTHIDAHIDEGNIT